MRNRTKVVLLIVAGLLLIAGLAEAANDCKEHPLIRPWPGSELEPNCTYNNFNEYAFYRFAFVVYYFCTEN